MHFVFYNKQNTVFIAGGTGITPFQSLFTHETFNEDIDPKIYLGFRSKEFNIYEQELNSVNLYDSSVKLCVTFLRRVRG